MSNQSPTELLESLRANLQHFDESPNLGSTQDVAEIKHKLVRRIADVERIVQLTIRYSK